MLSFGLELELPDIDTSVEIPEELGSYDRQDYTIVNNCGVANDNLKKFVLIGSEINTTPTESVIEQLHIVEKLYKLFDTKTNHKSNLHIHVGVNDMLHSVEMIKEFQFYVNKYEDFVYYFIDPMPVPNSELMRQRIAHVRKSHQTKLTREAKKLIATARNHSQLRNALAVGRISRRAGINLKSLYSNGTIEFRHFFGTDDIQEYASALVWCEHFVKCFLSQRNPFASFESMNLKLPRMSEFNETLQLGFEFTNKKVKEKFGEAEYLKRLQFMKERGKIEAKHLGSMFG